MLFLFDRTYRGVPLTDDRYRQCVSGNEVQLTVENVRREDSGLYLVTAHTGSGDSSSRELELRVHDATYTDGDDPPTFLRRLSDLSVKVGTRTRFLVEIRSSSEITVGQRQNCTKFLFVNILTIVKMRHELKDITCK